MLLWSEAFHLSREKPKIYSHFMEIFKITFEMEIAENAKFKLLLFAILFCFFSANVWNENSRSFRTERFIISDYVASVAVWFIHSHSQYTKVQSIKLSKWQQ